MNGKVFEALTNILDFPSRLEKPSHFVSFNYISRRFFFISLIVSYYLCVEFLQYNINIQTLNLSFALQFLLKLTTNTPFDSCEKFLTLLNAFSSISPICETCVLFMHKHLILLYTKALSHLWTSISSNLFVKPLSLLWKKISYLCIESELICELISYLL